MTIIQINDDVKNELFKLTQGGKSDFSEDEQSAEEELDILNLKSASK